MKTKNNFEIITSKNQVPIGWMEVTQVDRKENLQFAIDQLETREVPYIIKRFRGKGVSIWRKRK